MRQVRRVIPADSIYRHSGDAGRQSNRRGYTTGSGGCHPQLVLVNSRHARSGERMFPAPFFDGLQRIEAGPSRRTAFHPGIAAVGVIMQHDMPPARQAGPCRRRHRAARTRSLIHGGQLRLRLPTAITQGDAKDIRRKKKKRAGLADPMDSSAPDENFVARRTRWA